MIPEHLECLGGLLGVNPVEDLGMVDVEHPHLRAVAVAGRVGCFSDCVEDVEERKDPSRARTKLADELTLGSQAGEVVPQTTAHAQGGSGLSGTGHDRAFTLDPRVFDVSTDEAVVGRHRPTSAHGYLYTPTWGEPHVK